MNATEKSITAERKNVRRASFTCGYRELSKAIDRCLLSVSTEETRYYLCGIFLDMSQRTGVRLVSTDGHRLTAVTLATASSPRGDLDKHDVGIILARKSARDLAYQLRRYKQPVTVEVERWQETVRIDDKPYAGDRYDVRVAFKGQEMPIGVDWIDGTYPDWQRVLPRLDKSAASLTFDARELCEALEPLKSKDRGQQFGIEIVGNEARLVAEHQEPIWGERRKQVRAGKRRGEWITVKQVIGYNATRLERRLACRAWNVATGCSIAGFNARYVLELIKPARGRVTFRGDIGRAYGGPWRIECENDPTATVVIMPCRV